MVTDDQLSLTTLHAALHEAATSQVENEGPLPTYTFRADKAERAAAEDICKRHGTSLPAFLRMCMRRLESDYRP